MICICIAMLLLALTGGMFLLAKTKKDNLGNFFHVISWFIIAVSLLCMLCCSICCVMGRCHMKKQHCKEMRNEECREEEQGCARFEQGMPGMHKRMIIMNENHCKDMEGNQCEEGEMNCAEGSMSGNCCKEGKMDCCKKMEGKGACPMEMKKDTVIIKKK